MDDVIQTERRAIPMQMARKHVYVLNSSSDFLDIVRQLLEVELYNITTTNVVPRSFETIAAAQPSLLIVDLVVGEQAGWDLLVRIRAAATTNAIPVLLMSTAPRLLERAKAAHEDFGGDRFLAKPFDLEELLDIVKQFIGTA